MATDWLGSHARMRHWRDFAVNVRAAQVPLAALPARELAVRLPPLRARLARDGVTGDALPQVMAIVAQTCHHTLGVAPFDTQLAAAHILLQGHLAEMATGEGKTLAAALAAAIGALAGMPVHVITANDYLVQRDAAALAPLYRALGLSVGAVTQPLDRAARRAAYACDITYCTAKELVFDYLRDGLTAPRGTMLEQRAAALVARGGDEAARPLLRGLQLAIVDEADSILIDEARVPLILSQPAHDATPALTAAAWHLSAALAPGEDCVPDAHTRGVRLTAAGRVRLLAQVDTGGGAWLNRAHCEQMVTLALVARHQLRRGRDYVVQAGKVHLIDETSGRRAEGRAWSNGLQQFVELKEGCAPSAALRTVAQITYQRFFPRYLKLCGMSGTLREARGELRRIYDLAVVRVPLRRPDRRRVLGARVFATTAQQWRAVIDSARALRAQGRPLLIGTDSVLASEALSRGLAAAQLPHQVLNAAQDGHEAQIIAAAGAPGAITVATNMAGRGTDIVLDTASRAAGGLHVICCQQNAARRIDRQLLGRCARQGDPGSAQYFITLDGPLLAHYGVKKNMFKIRYLQKPWVGQWRLRRAQQARTRQHVRERAALARHDDNLGDWLAFGGPQT
jgi:preprotein translocase subunit SecA